MFDPKIEHAQYCDYRGNASTDIADAKNLNDLAKRLNVPEGFWSVGFDFFLATCLYRTSQSEGFGLCSGFR